MDEGRERRVGVTFHSFRRSRISQWVMQGFSDEIIRRASGHRSLQAYQDYVRLDPAAIYRLVEPKNPKRYKGIKMLYKRPLDRQAW